MIARRSIIKTQPAIIIVAAIVWCGASLPGFAAETTHGQREFNTRCAMCHGAEARGDGWLADMLIRRPPSLRELKIKYGGSFPREEIARAIDGRTIQRTRGPHEMPAWGAIFKQDIETAAGAPRGVREEDEIAISYRIQALVEYLASLQD